MNNLDHDWSEEEKEDKIDQTSNSSNRNINNKNKENNYNNNSYNNSSYSSYTSYSYNNNNNNNNSYSNSSYSYNNSYNNNNSYSNNFGCYNNSYTDNDISELDNDEEYKQFNINHRPAESLHYGYKNPNTLTSKSTALAIIPIDETLEFKTVQYWIDELNIIDRSCTTIIKIVFTKLSECKNKQDISELHKISYDHLCEHKPPISNDHGGIKFKTAIVIWKMIFLPKHGFNRKLVDNFCEYLKSLEDLEHIDLDLWDELPILFTSVSYDFYCIFKTNIVHNIFYGFSNYLNYNNEHHVSISPSLDVCKNKTVREHDSFDSPRPAKINRNDSNETVPYNSTSQSPKYYNSYFLSGYTGLENQGATCYMNSLLQSLFMTPEFSRGIFAWKYDELRDGPSNECIALQLQKLFAKMLENKTSSVETTKLTKSFGWDDYDGFKQHDVQELCRVLFDALENNFRGTTFNNLINELYQGSIVDYVNCKGCGKSNERTDNYLDISLGVRDTYSLKQALDNFLKPELLEGDNAYRCGSCNNKCNAAKGLKFLTFPYILTFQLKRFDFDYETMDRTKLNNEFTFPFFVNLNPYVSNNSFSNDNDDNIEIKTNLIDNFSFKSYSELRSYSAESPYFYELFAVLIHSGSILSGHYYAYIKSFDDEKWIKFNDSRVSSSNIKEIRDDAFGGKSYSTANAYMLMYRQVNKDRNLKSLKVKDIESLVSVEDLSEELDSLSNDGIQLDIHFNGSYKNIHLSKKCTLKDFLKKAIEKHEIKPPKNSGELKLEDWARLRVYKYSSSRGAKTFTYELITSFNFTNRFDLLLEVKDPSIDWVEFSENDIYLEIIIVDRNLLEFLPPKIVNLDRDSTFTDFQTFLQNNFGIQVENQCICKLNRFRSGYKSNFDFLKVDKFFVDRILSAYSICENNEIYVEEVLEGQEPLIDFVYEKEKDLMTFQFNKLDNVTLFDQEVKINKSETLNDLKDKIAKKLNHDPSNLIITKGGTYGCETDFHDMTNKLCWSFINSLNSRIIVRKGIQLSHGEFNITFMLFDESTTSNRLQPFCTIALREDDTLFDIQSKLVPHFESVFKMNVDSDTIRVRNISNGRGSDVFKPNLLFRSNCNYISNGTKLCVQVIPDGNIYNEDYLYVCFQLIEPETYQLQPKIVEIGFPENSLFGDVYQKIFDSYGLEDFEVAMPPRYREIDVLEIADYPPSEWISSTDLDYHTTPIISSPFDWHVGDIIVVKKAGVPFKVLNDNELKLLKKKYYDTCLDYKYVKPKEVGISIKSKSFIAPN